MSGIQLQKISMGKRDVGKGREEGRGNVEVKKKLCAFGAKRPFSHRKSPFQLCGSLSKNHRILSPNLIFSIKTFYFIIIPCFKNFNTFKIYPPKTNHTSRNFKFPIFKFSHFCWKWFFHRAMNKLFFGMKHIVWILYWFNFVFLPFRNFLNSSE